MTEFDVEQTTNRVCAVIAIVCFIAFGVMLAWRG